MSRVDSEFKDRVHGYVAQIPKGKVMTYGQLAALAGAAWAAWEVGQIAHTGPSDLPWQRVVMKDGSLATGFPGGVAGHAAALEAEGVEIVGQKIINIESILWRPEAP